MIEHEPCADSKQASQKYGIRFLRETKKFYNVTNIFRGTLSR
jgi:hypothetical protein